jgi:hypothetical protein
MRTRRRTPSGLWAGITGPDPHAARRRQVALLPAAEGGAHLRRRPWLEHRVAAHSRNRRAGSADDHARDVLEIPKDVLGGQLGGHCPPVFLPACGRRLRALGRPRGARLRRHGDERVPKHPSRERQDRRSGAVAVQPLVRCAVEAQPVGAADRARRRLGP